MDKRDKIVYRIQNLLRMASDTSSPNEAAIAARRAQALMQQYNLDNADILMDTLSDTDIQECDATSAAGARIPHWISNLLVPVAKLYDCKVRYVYADRYSRVKVPQFVGVAEDAQVAAYTFEYLVREIKHHAALYQPMNKVYGHGMKGMIDFKEGASSSVLDMLVAMAVTKDDMDTHSSSGTDLVICKQQLIEAKYHIKYGRGKTRYARDSEGRRAGAEAGASINIREGVTGSTAAQERLQ